MENDVTDLDTRNSQSRSDPSDSRSRDRALHVAGHAAVALAQDVNVFYVTIGDSRLPPLSDIAVGWIDARVLVAWPDPWPNGSFARARIADRIIRTALAGSVAEQLYAETNSNERSSNQPVCEHDYEVAWAASELIWNDAQERTSYLQRTAHRLSVMMQFPEIHDQLFGLVAALEERGELFQSDIRAVVEAA